MINYIFIKVVGILLVVVILTVVMVFLVYLFSPLKKTVYFLIVEDNNGKVIGKQKLYKNEFSVQLNVKLYTIRYNGNKWEYLENGADTDWKAFDQPIISENGRIHIDVETTKSKPYFVILGVLEALLVIILIFFLLGKKDTDNNELNQDSITENEDTLDGFIKDDFALDETMVNNEQEQVISSSESYKSQEEADYQEAVSYIESENYDQALYILRNIIDYRDAVELIEEIELLEEIRQNSSSVSAGIRAAYGIGASEGIYIAGDMLESQKEIAESWSDIESISGFGVQTIGLKKDGSAVVAGDVTDKQKNAIQSWSDLIQVSSGQAYCVGLKKDGSVVAIGHNGDNQINVDDWKDINEIDTAWRLTAGLDRQGRIWLTGYRANTILAEIEKNKEDWTNVAHIALGGGGDGFIGRGHIVALKEDGTVVAAGDNEYGQCDVENWTDIVQISAGDWHTVGLKSDGTVVEAGWKGLQEYGDMEEWTDIVQISAGSGYTIGVAKDGTVLYSGNSTSGNKQDVLNWGKVVVYEEEE